MKVNDDDVVDHESKQNRVGSLAPLAIITPEGLGAMGENEWEQFELAVDSGASETVVNENMIVSALAQDGVSSRNGVEYEVANGIRIPNLGENDLSL